MGNSKPVILVIDPIHHRVVLEWTPAASRKRRVFIVDRNAPLLCAVERAVKGVTAHRHPLDCELQNSYCFRVYPRFYPHYPLRWEYRSGSARIKTQIDAEFSGFVIQGLEIGVYPGPGPFTGIRKGVLLAHWLHWLIGGRGVREVPLSALESPTPLSSPWERFPLQCKLMVKYGKPPSITRIRRYEETRIRRYEETRIRRYEEMETPLKRGRGEE